MMQKYKDRREIWYQDSSLKEQNAWQELYHVIMNACSSCAATECLRFSSYIFFSLSKKSMELGSLSTEKKMRQLLIYMLVKNRETL